VDDEPAQEGYEQAEVEGLVDAVSDHELGRRGVEVDEVEREDEHDDEQDDDGTQEGAQEHLEKDISTVSCFDEGLPEKGAVSEIRSSYNEGDYPCGNRTPCYRRSCTSNRVYNDLQVVEKAHKNNKKYIRWK